eukprot:g4255.t1
MVRDAEMEAAIQDLISRMTLEEKVGQVIQADIASVTPEEVREYNLGSILNGGGSAPGGDNRTAADNWLALADEFWLASTDTSDGGVGIPALWGTDAVHGHSNIVGATLFPHNIGLGMANDPDMMEAIGRATALEMRVTGMDWTFAPTIAVVRNDRWGRTYESYSEDPAIVTAYAPRIVEGLQGKYGTPDFLANGHLMATAKHFAGDGGTIDGRDQGENNSTEAVFREQQAAAYPPAIAAGVQSEEVNIGDPDYDPQFAYGYGIRYGENGDLPMLPEDSGLGEDSAVALSDLMAYGDPLGEWSLLLRDAEGDTRIGDSRGGSAAGAVTALPADRDVQEDTLLVTWTSQGSMLLEGRPANFFRESNGGLALQITYRVLDAPTGDVLIQMGEDQQDIYLDKQQMAQAFPGDKVQVVAGREDRRGRIQGRILEVLERNTAQLVGTYHLERGLGFVRPENRRVNLDVVVPPADSAGAKNGQIVVVEIIDQPSAFAPPLGKVSEVLGDAMAPGMEIEVALRSFDIPHEWPDAVLEEADRFGSKVARDAKKQRKDLTRLDFVTIDGEDAKDFDDAVYAEPTKGGGWKLWVAIADVSHYVKPMSPLDKQAEERGTSVYFPNYVVPMLPEVLSNGLCSLRPKVDRLAMVCEMDVTAKERRAEDASRDVIQWLKCEYLMEHVGDQMMATVTAVTQFGLFAELEDIYIEGLIHITTLPQDYYDFDPLALCLVGQETNRRFSLGDKALVQIARAHYILMNVECTDTALDELTTNFRYNDAVLRNVVIRRDGPETEETLIMKAEREENERDAARSAAAEARAAAREEESKAAPAPAASKEPEAKEEPAEEAVAEVNEEASAEESAAEEKE